MVKQRQKHNLNEVMYLKKYVILLLNLDLSLPKISLINNDFPSLSYIKNTEAIGAPVSNNQSLQAI